MKKLWLLEILSKLEIVFCGTGFCIQTWLPCSLENWLIDIQNAMSKFCLMKMEKINKKLTVVVATITKPKWGKTRRDKRKRGKHFVSVEQFFLSKLITTFSIGLRGIIWLSGLVSYLRYNSISSTDPSKSLSVHRAVSRSHFQIFTQPYFYWCKDVI